MIICITCYVKIDNDWNDTSDDHNYNNNNYRWVAWVGGVFVRLAEFIEWRSCVYEWKHRQELRRVHAVYTTTPPRWSWYARVGGWVAVSAALGGNGPDRGWGGPEKRRRRRIKWVGEQRPRLPSPLSRALSIGRTAAAAAAAATAEQFTSTPPCTGNRATLERPGPELMCVRVCTPDDGQMEWWTDRRRDRQTIRFNLVWTFGVLNTS